MASAVVSLPSLLDTREAEPTPVPKVRQTAFFLFFAASIAYAAEAPKNIILFIGDGMGHTDSKTVESYFSSADVEIKKKRLDLPKKFELIWDCILEGGNYPVCILYAGKNGKKETHH